MSGSMAAHRKRFAGRPAGDTGAADPAVAHALDAWQRGVGSEHAATLALSGARLLVPVVAVLPVPPFTPPALEGQTPPHQGTPHKESEMALPTLIGNDGRAAIIAFTGVAALARWRPDARPVATPAARVWQAALGEGNAVVIDVAGPVPFVIEGARLAALAAGELPPPAHLDPDIRAAIEAVAAGEPAITGVSLAPGGAEADLAVTLRLTDPAAVDAARRAAQAIAAALASRLRQRIALSAR
jgi:hypothetical protein